MSLNKPNSAVETAQASYNATLAQATASEKQVEAAGNQVTYSRLTAPFSGVITMVNVEENELVGSGTPVAILNAISEPEVKVGIPEVYISQIKKGQSVTIDFSTLSNQSFTGTVSEVGFSSAGGSTYPVIIRIKNPTENIRPGMAANVHFEFDQAKQTTEEKLVAPVAAVGEGNEGSFCICIATRRQSTSSQKTTHSNRRIGQCRF